MSEFLKTISPFVNVIVPILNVTGFFIIVLLYISLKRSLSYYRKNIIKHEVLIEMLIDGCCNPFIQIQCHEILKSDVDNFPTSDELFHKVNKNRCI